MFQIKYSYLCPGIDNWPLRPASRGTFPQIGQVAAEDGWANLTVGWYGTGSQEPSYQLVPQQDEEGIVLICPIFF